VALSARGLLGLLSGLGRFCRLGLIPIGLEAFLHGVWEGSIAFRCVVYLSSAMRAGGGMVGDMHNEDGTF